MFIYKMCRKHGRTILLLITIFSWVRWANPVIHPRFLEGFWFLSLGQISIKCGYSPWPQEQGKNYKDNGKEKKKYMEAVVSPPYSHVPACHCAIRPSASFPCLVLDITPQSGRLLFGTSLESLACRTIRYACWEHPAAEWLLFPVFSLGAIFCS